MPIDSSFKHDKTLDLGELLDQLENQLDRVKVLYEQYFMAILKVAPLQLHRDIERKFIEITQLQMRNTAARFRFNTLTQKFGVYNTYWRRTMRLIEQGRYVRDVARVKRRAERQGQDIPDELLVAMPKRMRDKIVRDRGKVADRADREREQPPAPGSAAAPPATASPPVGSTAGFTPPLPADDDEFDFDAAFDRITDVKTNPLVAAPPPPPPPPAPPQQAAPAPQPAPPPPQARAAPPPPQASAATASQPRPAPPAPRPPPTPVPGSPRPQLGPPPGMSEERTRDLFQRYVQARQLVGESTEGVTYEQLLRTLHREAPKIMQQHAAAGVEFSVLIKGDKVILKAKPKK